MRGLCNGSHSPSSSREATGTLNLPLSDESSQAAASVVIDYDTVILDSAETNFLLAPYDSGDHVHPTGAGYQAIAN